MALKTLSDANIDRVLADPPLIWQAIAPDDRQRYEQARRPRGLIARIFGRSAQASEPVPELTFSDNEGLESDLDKAWHGIHYLLTESAWQGDEPFNFLLAGGLEVSGIDVGYGPARVMKSHEVSRVDYALRAVDVDFLRSRFNPTKMMKLQIYPEIWDGDPKEDDTFDYCVERFAELKSFVARATEWKLGLLIFVC